MEKGCYPVSKDCAGKQPFCNGSAGGAVTAFSYSLKPKIGQAGVIRKKDRRIRKEKKMNRLKKIKELEHRIGYHFQDFNLLDTFSVRDNIYLPLVLEGKHYREMEAKILPVAKKLGITDILEKYPYEISGGQKQRAAVARALITNPRLILADEPTGALDSRSTEELLDLFSAIHAEGHTILMVTHSVKAASRAGRVLFIKDGEVFHQLYRGNSSNQEMYEKISNTLTALAGGEQL